MNFNDTIQVKLGNSAEIDLIKLGNGPVIYERLPLYVPYEFKQRSDIEHVKTMVNKTHTDLSYMFYGSYNLLSVTTRNWDTSNVTTMKSMFEGSGIGSWGLDLSKWDTGNVTDMNSMFCRCLLTSLDIAHFDTSNVTDMGSMFRENLFRTLDISNWDLSKVTNMSGMFYLCSNLQEIDLSNCTNSHINGIFDSCPKLLSVNLSNYNTETFFNDNKYLSFFDGSENLKTLRLDNCNKNTISLIMSASTTLTGLVDGETRKIYCKQSEVPDEPLLSTLLNLGWEFIYIENPEEPIEPYLYRTYDYAYHGTITEVNTIVNESHTSLDHMFYECNNLVSVNTIEWNTGKVTDMNNMFYGCANLTSLNLNSFDTSNVTDMSYMFCDCAGLTTLDLNNFDTSNAIDMQRIFCNCNALAELHLSGWDMSKVTDTSSMFYDCKKLSVLDLFDCSKDTISKIITSAGFPKGTINGATRKIYCQEANTTGLTAPNGWEFVDATPYKVGDFANNTEITEVTATVNNTCTDLSNMFYWCSNLTTVNTTEWDTSNVTTMANMFYRCIKLTSLNLSKFNTSKVTNMSGMFEACDLLDTLSIANFDTSNVTTMANMFHNCHSLTTLNLSHFDVSKVENMSKMFDSCDSLQTLNLSGWDMTNVTNVENMFNGCNNLRSLRLDNCDNATIKKITNSSILPPGKTPNGSTRYIYCKEENFTGAGYPEGWKPSFI